MASSSGGNSNSNPYAPSAPPLPGSYVQPQAGYDYQQSQTQPQVPPQEGYGYSGPGPSHGQYGQHTLFPSGTHPDVRRNFELVDRDRSGYIDDHELQQALASAYQRLNLRTIRLLMFLFKESDDSLRIGPSEFSALWSCLHRWRSIFETFDRDRSGKIELFELKDALYSLGYAIPPSVLQLLISKYNDGHDSRGELRFDSFVECGVIIKGLTDKFKEKDPHYTGSARLTYDSFLCMVIPFLVQYD